MTRRVLRIWSMTLALGLVADATANRALAGMAVSPLKQTVTVRPGEAGKVHITLGHSTRGEFAPPVSMRLEVMDFDLDEEGGIRFVPAGTGLRSDSASKWVSVGETIATLQQDETRRVECTIKPPLNAQPGEYYAAVMVSQDSGKLADQGVAVEYRIATGIFVTIPGRELIRQAKIERRELIWPDSDKAPASQPSAIKAPASQPRTLPTVALLLHNVGRARFDVTGKVRILDSRSRVVLTEPLRSRRPCVFAGDSRVFYATLKKPLPAGKYTAKIEVSYESIWSRLREQLPLEIFPEQAAQMVLWTRGYVAGQIPLEVKPDKVALTVYPRAVRSVGLAVRNIGDGPIHGVTSIASAAGTLPASWITLAPGEFNIAKAGTKSVRLQVRVPVGTRAGKYESAVVLRAESEGVLQPQECKVPVEIEVKAER